MTSFLIAAIGMLTVLTLLNLLLTFGVIQRLRTQATHHQRTPAYPVETLPVGTAMPDVAFAAVDGSIVEFADAAAGRTLIAFVSMGCTPCHEQLPTLRSVVESMVQHGDRAVVVALTHNERATEFVDAFAGLAAVVLQTDQGEEVSKHFAVSGYPTYVMFDGGVVERGFGTAAELDAVARA